MDIINTMLNIRKNDKIMIFAFSAFLILIFVSSTNCSNSCLQRVSYNLNENSDIFVQRHKIRISILDFDKIYVSETFVIENKGSDPIFSIKIWLNRTIENIEIVDTNGGMDFVQIVYGEGIACDIDFRVAISTDQIASFDVKYNLVRNTRLEENLNLFYFIFDPLLSYSTQELVISLILPENYAIHVFEDNDSLSYPIPAEILELEPSITLQWIFLNQDTNSKNEIFIFLKKM